MIYALACGSKPAAPVARKEELATDGGDAIGYFHRALLMRSLSSAATAESEERSRTPGGRPVEGGRYGPWRVWRESQNGKQAIVGWIREFAVSSRKCGEEEHA